MTTFQVDTKAVTVGGSLISEGQLALRSLQFVLETRNIFTDAPLKSHTWGYDWDNQNAKWLSSDNPPAPDPVCVRDEPFHHGTFTNCHGIDGLPWN